MSQIPFRILSVFDDFICNLLLDKFCLHFDTHKVSEDYVAFEDDCKQVLIHSIQLYLSQAISLDALVDVVCKRTQRIQALIKVYPKDIQLFRSHLKQYLNIFSMEAGFEIRQTFRFQSLSNKNEAAVVATRDWEAGTLIYSLCGFMAELSEQEEFDLEQKKCDFSVIWSNRKKQYCLLLGPARFVNVSSALTQHECVPNCKFHPIGTNAVVFKVISPILAGDEITVSYGDNYFGAKNGECLCTSCVQTRDFCLTVGKRKSSQKAMQKTTMMIELKQPKLECKLCETFQQKDREAKCSKCIFHMQLYKSDWPDRTGVPGEDMPGEPVVVLHSNRTGVIIPYCDLDETMPVPPTVSHVIVEFFSKEGVFHVIHYDELEVFDLNDEPVQSLRKKWTWLKKRDVSIAMNYVTKGFLPPRFQWRYFYQRRKTFKVGEVVEIMNDGKWTELKIVQKTGDMYKLESIEKTFESWQLTEIVEQDKFVDLPFPIGCKVAVKSLTEAGEKEYEATVVAYKRMSREVCRVTYTGFSRSKDEFVAVSSVRLKVAGEILETEAEVKEMALNRQVQLEKRKQLSAMKVAVQAKKPTPLKKERKPVDPEMREKMQQQRKLRLSLAPRRELPKRLKDDVDVVTEPKHMSRDEAMNLFPVGSLALLPWKLSDGNVENYRVRIVKYFNDRVSVAFLDEKGNYKAKFDELVPMDQHESELQMNLTCFEKSSERDEFPQPGSPSTLAVHPSLDDPRSITLILDKSTEDSSFIDIINVSPKDINLVDQNSNPSSELNSEECAVSLVSIKIKRSAEEESALMKRPKTGACDFHLPEHANTPVPDNLHNVSGTHPSTNKYHFTGSLEMLLNHDDPPLFYKEMNASKGKPSRKYKPKPSISGIQSEIVQLKKMLSLSTTLCVNDEALFLDENLRQYIPVRIVDQESNALSTKRSTPLRYKIIKIQDTYDALPNNAEWVAADKVSRLDKDWDLILN